MLGRRRVGELLCHEKPSLCDRVLVELDGAFFDNVAGRRRSGCLLKWVVPYAVGSVGYEFEIDEWFETLGAGADFRPSKHQRLQRRSGVSPRDIR
jgi:hypothetical protein